MLRGVGGGGGGLLGNTQCDQVVPSPRIRQYIQGESTSDTGSLSMVETGPEPQMQHRYCDQHQCCIHPPRGLVQEIFGLKGSFLPAFGIYPKTTLLVSALKSVSKTIFKHLPSSAGKVSFQWFKVCPLPILPPNNDLKKKKENQKLEKRYARKK